MTLPSHAAYVGVAAEEGVKQLYEFVSSDALNGRKKVPVIGSGAAAVVASSYVGVDILGCPFPPPA